MPSKWPLVPIGSVASVFDGPHATPKKTDAGPVFLGISSLNWGRLDLATPEHLSEDDFLKWTRRVSPQADDVVFSYETRLGQAAIIPPGLRCCLGRRMALVRTDNNRLLPRFFLYYFLSDEFQALLRSRTIHGSTVERLPLTDFPEFPVRLPPLSVQREIADALSALDDKIALLRETNATLEAIAQALFKSWFVDFDPVRARLHLPSPPGRGAGGEGTPPNKPLRPRAPLPTETLEFARQLRIDASDAEALMWRLLRSRQLANAKFRRQHPFPPYVLDFYCHEHQLAVEIDGGQHNEEAQQRHDVRRSEYLAERGIRVLRFWNNEVLRETEAVAEAVYAALTEETRDGGKSGRIPSPPAPLPGGEGSHWLPPEVADLFPSAFEDSELGEIPKGWRSGTLADIAQLNPESWTAKKHPSTVSYVDLANTKDNVIADVTDYAFDEAPSRARRVLRDGDTIVGTVRPGNRSFAYIHEPPSNLTASTGFAVLRPTGVHLAGFLYLAATQDSSIEHLAHVADGAAYPAVRPEVVAGIRCTIPNDDVMRAFHNVAAPMLGSIAENHRKAGTLAELRDTLLPRLMSGKLRIPEIREAVEEATA